MKKKQLKKQIKIQKKINNIAVGDNCELIQKLAFMDKELNRLNIIINYLETKNNE